MNQKIEIKIVNDELYPYFIVIRGNKHHDWKGLISEKTIKEYEDAKKVFDKAWKKLKDEMNKR